MCVCCVCAGGHGLGRRQGPCAQAGEASACRPNMAQSNMRVLNHFDAQSQGHLRVVGRRHAVQQARDLRSQVGHGDEFLEQVLGHHIRVPAVTNVVCGRGWGCKTAGGACSVAGRRGKAGRARARLGWSHGVRSKRWVGDKTRRDSKGRYRHLGTRCRGPTTVDCVRRVLRRGRRQAQPRLATQSPLAQAQQGSRPHPS